MLLSAALLFASCAGASNPPLEAAVSVVAVENASSSLGFDVNRHGWFFENYEASEPQLFGVTDAVALFGDAAVCVEISGDCTPTPAAAEWIDMVASAMEYGVCEGLTIASVDRFLVGAAPETGSLVLTSELERQIARLFATQFLHDVIAATKDWRDQSVTDIVSELQASLADPFAEQYTLGVYSKFGGHSVLPYAVDLDSQGRGVIFVYDPNWPGEKRYIEVDTQANRWRFSYFAADQVTDPEAWTGGNGRIDLTPLSVREAPFSEPFKGSGTGVKQLLAISSSARNWTLTSADGVLDAKSVVPGRDGVVAVTRGAPLDRGSQPTHLVLVEWSEDAELQVEDGAAKLSLFTKAGAGSVVVSDTATIKVQAPPSTDSDEETTGLTIEVDVAKETKATVTIASATERIQVKAEADRRTSVQLATSSTRIEVTDTQGINVVTVEVPRSDERLDIVVDKDGDIETYVPQSISVEERIEAIEESKELLVGDDVTSRTVEVSSIVAEKVEIKDLGINTTDEAKTTTTLDQRSAVSTDSKDDEERTLPADITENDVTGIRVNEAGDSGTLILANGSEIQVRISSNGDVVTSDGRTVDITVKPSKDEQKKEADTTSDKNTTERKKEETTDSNKDEPLDKKEADTTSDKNTTERKKEETTDSNKGASDFKLGDSKSETPKKDDPASFDSESDNRASDFKLEDKKR
ncbi:MAG: hypothetical protein CL504_00145 [Actinobacteria bacterium]|nr:hypothetical protein [Actinomycetota bacterium]